MKTRYFLVFLILVAVCVKCSNESKSPTSATPTVSTIEGTVIYFEGGGTVEMIYPPGFILINYQWITPPPDSSYGMIYLVDKVDSSYIDKHVRVVGKAEKITLTGSPPSYKYAILNISVNTLEVIN
jgi:hypothetical protein